MSAGNCSGSFTESNGIAGTDCARAPLLPAMSNAVKRLFMSTPEFEDVEAGIAIHDIDEPAAVDVHVVGLRRGLAGGGLGDVPADFLRRRRIRDVDDA